MCVAVTVNEVKLLHFLIRVRSTLSCNPINVFSAHILPLTCHLHKIEMDVLRFLSLSLSLSLSPLSFFIYPSFIFIDFIVKLLYLILLGENGTYFYTTLGSLRCEI